MNGQANPEKLGTRRSASARPKRLSRAALVVFACLLAIAASPATAGDFEISHWTIAGGGVIESESDDGLWKLSGTIGQWEATEARALAGGPWRLTGGFWGLSLEELADFLFRDRFEEEMP